MKNSLLFDFTVDKATKTVHVNKEFDAELSLVWDAFTKQEILDQWWAPKPYKSQTKKMNFKSGGSWFYCMINPENEVIHWCKADIKKVDALKNYEMIQYFCDEHEIINTSMPSHSWKVNFKSIENKTLVTVEISCEKQEHMQMLIDMGFEAGFTMALGNLDELLGIKI